MSLYWIRHRSLCLTPFMLPRLVHVFEIYPITPAGVGNANLLALFASASGSTNLRCRLTSLPRLYISRTALASSVSV